MEITPSVILGFSVGFLVAMVIEERRYFQVKREIDRLFKQSFGKDDSENKLKSLSIQDLLEKKKKTRNN